MYSFPLNQKKIFLSIILCASVSMANSMEISSYMEYRNPERIDHTSLIDSMKPKRNTPYSVTDRNEKLYEYFLSPENRACGFRLFGYNRKEGIQKIKENLTDTFVAECIKNEIERLYELDKNIFQNLFPTFQLNNNLSIFSNRPDIQITYLNYILDPERKTPNESGVELTITNNWDSTKNRSNVYNIKKTYGLMDALSHLEKRNLYVYIKTEKDGELNLIHRFVNLEYTKNPFRTLLTGHHFNCLIPHDDNIGREKAEENEKLFIQERINSLTNSHVSNNQVFLPQPFFNTPFRVRLNHFEGQPLDKIMEPSAQNADIRTPKRDVSNTYWDARITPDNLESRPKKKARTADDYSIETPSPSQKYTLLSDQTGEKKELTAISICSGVGATDRTLLKSGIRIIASVDIDYNSSQINIKNNVDCLSEDKKYNVLNGDITKTNTQDKINNIVTQRIGSFGKLDILYTFVASGKHIDGNAIEKSVLDLTGFFNPSNTPDSISSASLPKLIYFEKTTGNNYCRYDSCFYQKCNQQFRFSEYGLPVNNNRYYTVFIRNDLAINHCDQLSFLIFPQKSLQIKTIKDALNVILPDSKYSENNSWWQEECPDGKQLPLHKLSYPQENAQRISEYIDAIPAAGSGYILEAACAQNSKDKCNTCSICIAKKEIGEKYMRTWRRYKENEYFGSITQKQSQWLAAIHPNQHRAFTILELAILQGLNTLGNFLLTLKNTILVYEILIPITNITPPDFLLQIFTKSNEFLKGKGEPIEMDTSELPPYFFNGLLKPSAHHMIDKHKLNIEKNIEVKSKLRIAKNNQTGNISQQPYPMYQMASWPYQQHSHSAYPATNATNNEFHLQWNFLNQQMNNGQNNRQYSGIPSNTTVNPQPTDCNLPRTNFTPSTTKFENDNHMNF